MSFIDRDELYREWEPEVKRRAANKAKRLAARGGAIVDPNAIEGVGLNALKRAADQWPGAGEFKPYLLTAVRHAWADEDKKERRHRHFAYPTAKNEDGDSENGVGGRGLNFEAETALDDKGKDSPVFRIRRRRFHGRDSVVLTAVMQREQAEDFVKGGMAEVLRKLGASPEEIRAAVREKNRRIYHSDRQHPERAALRFNALFKDAGNQSVA